MKFGTLLIFLLTGLYFCEDEKSACPEQLIHELEQQPVRNPPAEIWAYQIGEKTYYLESAACCDQYSNLYDDNCNLICHPSGGIVGTGDGKCGELSAKLINGILVWRDKRK